MIHADAPGEGTFHPDRLLYVRPNGPSISHVSAGAGASRIAFFHCSGLLAIMRVSVKNPIILTHGENLYG